MEMKKNVGIDALLPYPNFSEEFIIYTDSSNMHLNRVKSQYGKPIEF